MVFYLYSSHLRRKLCTISTTICKMSVLSPNILGIETSCDDTGCAIVNGDGKLLGESLYSQNTLHIRFGGINPIVAYEMHRENIEAAVTDSLTNAKLSLEDIDAIAVTTKPGLLISLEVGVKYAKFLSKKFHKPLIPIHHMEAHALMARMYNNIKFPFLVLLLSGGDCLIAVAQDVGKFLLLGKTLDNAPGEVLDKVARRLKLKNKPEFSTVAGGKAIELIAKKSTCPRKFEFPLPLIRSRDCNFSFSGLKDSLERKLRRKEIEHGVMGDEIIPEVSDLCASFQLAVAEHIAHRTERALIYCERNNLILNDKNIVVSGGVACNNFIFNALDLIGEKNGYKVYRPPQRLCTDNGVMIAWNGIEKYKKQFGLMSNIDLIDIDPQASFGKDCIDDVKAANIPLKITRLNKLFVL